AVRVAQPVGGGNGVHRHAEMARDRTEGVSPLHRVGAGGSSERQREQQHGKREGLGTGGAHERSAFPPPAGKNGTKQTGLAASAARGTVARMDSDEADVEPSFLWTG